MKLLNKPSSKELVAFANTEKAKCRTTKPVTCLVQRMPELLTTPSANTLRIIEITYSETFYGSGEVECKTPYVEGKKQGTQIWYYKDGAVESKVPYVDGKRDGTEIRYHKNGKIKCEVPFVDGQIHGTAIWNHESGEVWRKFEYVDGEEHGTETWYENGEVVRVFTYEKGRRRNSANTSRIMESYNVN